jgi:hypothetical protein
MTAAELSPELRQLIDSRLDAIDRVLLRAEIGWTERRSIVGEVETQIFELLARRTQLPTIDDVNAVLAAIDPPESYLPEGYCERLAVDDAARPAARSVWPQWSRETVRLVTRFSIGALYVASLLVVNGILVLIIAASDGVIPWIVTLGSLAWLNYVTIQSYRAWSATRRGHLLHDVRESLAAWLMPKENARSAC